jgi:hypothetical protein
MNEPVHNSGVYISGGVVSGPIAAGKGAQATQVGQAADILGQIDVLLRAMTDETRALEPGRAEDAMDDIDRVRAEIHHRKPDLESVRRLLTRLAVTAGSAVGLLAKIDEVRDLVTQLVH